MTEESTIIQRLWNYCNVLRDDGVSYGDYVEQLTYLLFLKMADEQSKPPFNKPSIIPPEMDWQSLLSRNGAELENHYRKILESLGKEAGMLGVIFRKSQNRIQDPAKLRRLVEMINGETWMGLDVDIKGAIYEGLLENEIAIAEALTGKPVFLLKGGTASWIAAQLPLQDGETHLASPRIDRYRRPYEGTDNPREAMQAYLDWEYGLVAQLARDATHGFFVI